MSDTEWGLVWLSGVITVGSLIATGFTLRHLLEMRRARRVCQRLR